MASSTDATNEPGTMTDDPYAGSSETSQGKVFTVTGQDWDSVTDAIGEHAEERIIDVQWQTDHLASLGVIEVERDEYLGLLAEALAAPAPAWPSREEEHA